MKNMETNMGKRVMALALGMVLSATVFSVASVAALGSTDAPSTTSPISVIIKPTSPPTTEREIPRTTEPRETTQKQTEPRGQEQEEEPVERPVYDPDPEEPTSPPETTLPATEGETLPDGSFYVYLETNNGERRLKTLLTEPDTVSEPNAPARKGFLFAGWYRDAAFTKKWDFDKTIAHPGDVIYAKWTADPNAKAFSVTVKNGTGGTVKADKTNAMTGDTVTLEVVPDEGKRLSKLLVNGKEMDVFTFKMPAGTVLIEAVFEDIPEMQHTGISAEKKLYLALGGLGVALLIAAVIVTIVRRRKMLRALEEASRAQEPEWIDTKAILKDGFQDGRIVKDSGDPPLELSDDDNPDD